MKSRKKPLVGYTYMTADQCGHSVQKSENGWLAAEIHVRGTGGMGPPVMLPFTPAPGSTITKMMHDFNAPEKGWQKVEVVTF